MLCDDKEGHEAVLALASGRQQLQGSSLSVGLCFAGHAIRLKPHQYVFVIWVALPNRRWNPHCSRLSAV